MIFVGMGFKETGLTRIFIPVGILFIMVFIPFLIGYLLGKQEVKNDIEKND